MRSKEDILDMLCMIDELEESLQEEKGEELTDFTKGFRAALKWVLEEE